MARDGTYRGGRRVKAGSKPEALTDKLAVGNKNAKILEMPLYNYEQEFETTEFDDLPELQGEEVPKPSEYLNSKQKDGKPLGADKIYYEIWEWLTERNCEKFINHRLVELYAQAFARYIQCEEAISTYGFLSKHPTTGGPIANPFVQMSISFQKQANLIWYEIFDIVKQNCTTDYKSMPQKDAMEILLNGRG